MSANVEVVGSWVVVGRAWVAAQRVMVVEAVETGGARLYVDGLGVVAVDAAAEVVVSAVDQAMRWMDDDAPTWETLRRWRAVDQGQRTRLVEKLRDEGVEELSGSGQKGLANALEIALSVLQELEQ